jgi:hypothetical protein
MELNRFRDEINPPTWIPKDEQDIKRQQEWEKRRRTPDYKNLGVIIDKTNNRIVFVSPTEWDIDMWFKYQGNKDRYKCLKVHSSLLDINESQFYFSDPSDHFERLFIQGPCPVNGGIRWVSATYCTIYDPPEIPLDPKEPIIDNTS